MAEADGQRAWNDAGRRVVGSVAKLSSKKSSKTMNLTIRIPKHLLIDKHDGEYLPPWFYGWAYRDIAIDYIVFAVMPFNWIIRAGRWVQYKWDRMRGVPPRWVLVGREELCRWHDESFKRGMREALRDAYEALRYIAE